MNTHPKHWCIEATEENFAELYLWWKANAGKYFEEFKIGNTLMSSHPDGSCYYANCIDLCIKQYPNHKPITIEQFRQITNSTPNPMPKTIQISRQLLNEYYDAATGPQKEYLTEHFKLDGTTTDEAIRKLHAMACDTWKPRIKKNHPDCFPEESKHFDFSGVDDVIVSHEIADKLGMPDSFIQVRNNRHNPETHHCSFYLSSKVNWEFKQEGCGDNGPIYVLIPTKKLS